MSLSTKKPQPPATGKPAAAPSKGQRKQSVGTQALEPAATPMPADGVASTSALMLKAFSSSAGSSTAAAAATPPAYYVAPEVMRLALQFARRTVLGSTERAVQMLATFRFLVDRVYHAPSNVAINRHLDAWLRPQIAYLVAARPLSVSMGHAIRFLKLKISQLPPDVTEDAAKRTVVAALDAFVRERFSVPRDLIIATGVQKIKPGDVILTYSRYCIHTHGSVDRRWWRLSYWRRTLARSAFA